ncbi:MAG: 4-hydroxy-tetrahydrodipicolinate synthase [Yoonia sp.]|jgi:4-hydroxy-tetrahydrodipicolinate synthase
MHPKETHMPLFNGLSAFPITPSDESGQVDTDGVSRLVARLEAANVASIGLLGSTGTYAYLSRSERLRAVKAAATTIKGTPLIVGVGTLRTSDAVALAEDAQMGGATALLLAPVSYTPLTQDEVFAHFRTVATATDLPICIYNNPSTTHFNFGLPLLQQLADLPNITAVKMPLPAKISLRDELAQLRASLPKDFAIGYSGDWGCAEALLAGADTWYSVLGGVLPQVAQDLTATAQSGDEGAATAQDAAVQPLWELFKEFGSLRVVYAIAKHLGITDAVPPRPILPVGPDVEKRIISALKKNNLV